MQDIKLDDIPDAGLDLSDIPDATPLPKVKLAVSHQPEDNRTWWEKAFNINNPEVKNKDRFGLPAPREDSAMFGVDTSSIKNPYLKIPIDLAVGVLSDPLTPLGGSFLNRSKITIEKELPKLKSEVPKVNEQLDLPLNKPQVAETLTDLPKASFGPETIKPVASHIVGEAAAPERPEIVNVLLDRLRGAKTLNKIQRRMYKEEHSTRGLDINTAPGEGKDWSINVKKAAQGEYEKVPDFAPLTLEPADVDQLYNVIKNNPNIRGFENVRGVFALEKLLSGKIPQRNELELLERAYGSDLVQEILLKRPKVLNFFGKTDSAAKTIMSSMDMSAPLRQGLPLIHKKEWWTSLDDMVRSWGSQNFFDATMDSIKSHPNYAAMRQGGLALTDPKSILNKEEGFMKSFAEKIPGVQASERAYVGFLNKLRSDVFNNLYDVAVKNGEGSAEAAEHIAKYINIATGRGELGSIGKINLEKHAEALNHIFYSPRFMASRFNLLKNPFDPQFYINTPDYVRKEYLKSFLSTATAIGTATTLGNMALDSEAEKDPRSTDFGKINAGRVRIDPGASFIQPLVAAARIATGQYKTNKGRLNDLNTGKFGSVTKKDIVERFFRNKLGPAASMMYDQFEGTDATGKKVQYPQAVLERFSPMFLQDLYEIMQSDEDYGLDLPDSLKGKLPGIPEDKRELLGIPASFFGMGSQKY